MDNFTRKNTGPANHTLTPNLTTNHFPLGALGQCVALHALIRRGGRFCTPPSVLTYTMQSTEFTHVYTSCIATCGSIGTGASVNHSNPAKIVPKLHVTELRQAQRCLPIEILHGSNRSRSFLIKLCSFLPGATMAPVYARSRHFSCRWGEVRSPQHMRMVSSLRLQLFRPILHVPLTSHSPGKVDHVDNHKTGHRGVTDGGLMVPSLCVNQLSQRA